MKKSYWYFLAIFIAFVSVVTLMPQHMMTAQAEDTEGADDSQTIDEAENAFGRNDTFEPGEPNPDDVTDDVVKEDFGGGQGDDDDDDDDDDFQEPG